MSISIAFAIPAYNEAGGIVDFVRAIDLQFKDWDGDVTFVIVDDCSSDATVRLLEDAEVGLASELQLIKATTNSGHGPTVLRAYREAIRTGADLTLQIDGDGQFDPEDIRRVADSLRSLKCDVVMGRRRFRRDPWFRKVLTLALRTSLRLRTGLPVTDPNCPLRGYRSDALEGLLRSVPDAALVPNIYLALLAHRARLRTVEITVEHLERGHGPQGTMWGTRQRRFAIPKRLVLFVWKSYLECRLFLRTIDFGEIHGY